MILAALLLAAPPTEPLSAIEAELAFSKDAKDLGQWTAFRKWAAERAQVFDPWRVPLETFLRDRPDPEIPLDWWPVLSLVSCDGADAFNMGYWRAPSGAVGYFVTHWVRTPAGWRYTLDGGAALPAIPERVAAQVVSPDCTVAARPMLPIIATDPHPHSAEASADNSAVFEFRLDRETGGFYAKLRRWNGTTHEEIWKEQPR